jgi:hypothetical protein
MSGVAQDGERRPVLACYAKRPPQTRLCGASRIIIKAPVGDLSRRVIAVNGCRKPVVLPSKSVSGVRTSDKRRRFGSDENHIHFDLRSTLIPNSLPIG